jgi:hypothetical protein
MISDSEAQKPILLDRTPPPTFPAFFSPFFTNTMTLNISLDVVQSRIQLCKEWRDAPFPLKEQALALYVASLELLRLDELRDLYYMAIYGKPAKALGVDISVFQRSDILEYLKDDRTAYKWERALKRVMLKGLPVLI